jgi:hypothetical protein
LVSAIITLYRLVIHIQSGRWRPLEAVLASIGSQAEAVLDCVEEEIDAGRSKPIDIDYLLAEVVPSILTLTGMPDVIIIIKYITWRGRASVPPRSRLCLRKSVRETVACAIGRPVS